MIWKVLMFILVYIIQAKMFIIFGKLIEKDKIMKQRKPSEEYLDFLRKYKEEEIKFLTESDLILKYDNIQEYLQDKINEHIQYHIDAGFTPYEIEKAFKGISLLNEKNLNL